MNELTVKGQCVDTRSDHMIAVLEYALEQMTTSDIHVLDFGRNDQGLDIDEQIAYVTQQLHDLKKLEAGQGTIELLVVAADQESLDKYHNSL